MKQSGFIVVVITSDGDELEDTSIEAQTKRDAAGKAWNNLGLDGVQTMFVSNADDPADRAVYQQQGRKLVVE